MIKNYVLCIYGQSKRTLTLIFRYVIDYKPFEIA